MTLLEKQQKEQQVRLKRKPLTIRAHEISRKAGGKRKVRERRIVKGLKKQGNRQK